MSSAGGGGTGGSGSSTGGGSGLPATTPTVPIISVQPQDATGSAGDSITLTVDATGNPPPTAQWQVSTDNGTIWVDLDGETGWTLTLTATTDLDGTHYRAILTNDNGTTITDAAVLTVLATNTSPPSTPTPTDEPADDTDTQPNINWHWIPIAIVILLILVTLGLVLARRR